jgi:type II secretory pathway pseudopilin PulG
MSRLRTLIASRSRSVRRRLAVEESGMTIFEVLVAAIVLIGGALATFQLFDTASRNTFRAEQSQVANDIAQRELEKIRLLDYKKVALSGYPGSSADPLNPNNRVLGTDFALERDGSSAATMVVNGSALYDGGQVSGGTVLPGPTPFTNGDVSGNIYRYVVWRNDPTCLVVCPGAQDYKRVVVGVTIDDAAISNDRNYVEIQSDFIDPKDNVLSEINLPETGPVTADQFYLTDTACEYDGSTTRQETTSDHLLHNTLGSCKSGPRTGSTAGAPDTLSLTVPPDAFPDDPLLPDSFDYADDTYLEPTPDFDDGLQMLRQTASGCSYSPGGTNPEARIHRWVTDPMALAYTMTGHATLELNSKTINAAQHVGKICAYLFVRTTVDPGPLLPEIVTDTRLLDTGSGNAFWTFQPPGNWAAGSWGTYRISLDFAPVALIAGQRLGLALSVHNSSPGDLQFLYDHPQFDSRLEVDTTTPLGG